MTTRPRTLSLLSFPSEFRFIIKRPAPSTRVVFENSSRVWSLQPLGDGSDFSTDGCETHVACNCYHRYRYPGARVSQQSFHTFDRRWRDFSRDNGIVSCIPSQSPPTLYLNKIALYRTTDYNGLRSVHTITSSSVECHQEPLVRNTVM